MAFDFPRTTAVVSSLYLNLICLSVSASSVLVDSPFGKIQGEFVPESATTHSSIVFRNIPYAKPPVGDLRFAKPEPHPKIDGIFDATQKRVVMCIHPDVMLFGYDQGSEDCLTLNIFAKNINPGEQLKKVMVFIHGGGYIVGMSGFYDMTSFVTTHDVIGVTINYRLGILGFLSTGNEAGPGNYGLWDQTMALKWVKDNIKAFGGDPDDITISGESAGGSSVGYQSLSPASKGLFSKACPQSGTASSVFGEAIDVQKHALMIAQHAKCWEGEVTDKLDVAQSKTLMQCLRKVDFSAFSSFANFSLNEPQFVPRVDGDFVPRKPQFLLQDESYLKSIGFYARSYLVSIVNNEFAIMKTFLSSTQEMILSSNTTKEEEKKHSIFMLQDRIKNFYLQSRLNLDDVPSSMIEDIMDFYSRRNVGDDAILDMVTDLSFLIPSYDFLNAASAQRKCKSWFLYFNEFPAYMKGAYKGTVHAADLLYWHDLRVDDMEKLLHVGMQGELDERDLQLKTLFSSVLVEFMKNGDPGLGLKEVVPSGWPVYEPHSSYYLNFNLEPSVRSHLEREKRDLWLKTIPSWMKKPHKHTEL